MMGDAWPLVPLGEVLTPVSRPEDVQPQKIYHILGAHWYAEGLYTKAIKLGAQIQAAKLYRVEKGDFVYNRLFAWKGSFAVATQENHGCYVSNEFPCFVIKADHVDAQFLQRYFCRASVWEEALGLSTGGTPTSRNRLKEEKLVALKIPLPLLAEQRRVVARIEELSAKIAEARSLRDQSTEEANAVLASKSSELFESLVECCKAPIRVLGANGANPIQIGPFGAQLHASEFVEKGVPVLNVGNVWPEGLRLDHLDHVTPEKAARLHRYTIQESDLLFARSGATLGKVCMVPPGYNGWLMTGHLFRVRFDQSRCDPRFAFSALRSVRGIREQVFGQVRGATRPGFNTTLLGNVELPLPPLPEQRRIVMYLNDLQAKVDVLKRLQAETAAELDAFLPAVLDRAFKGEL